MKIIIIFFIFIFVSFLVFFLNAIKIKTNNFFLSLLNKYDYIVKKGIVDIDLKEIIRLEIILFCFVVIFSFLVKEILIFLFSIPAYIIAPKLYLEYKKKEYITQYYKSMIDFLESIISNLKSGLSIIKALQIYAQREKGPSGNEISIILKKVELGKSLQDALWELSERIPLRENQIMISAIANGIETGGNITEILENILQTIRKREELNREIKALTSQGILSGLIVGLLPFLLVAALLFIDPDFIKPLFSTTMGNILLITAIIMEIIGAFFIKKIIDIK